MTFIVMHTMMNDYDTRRSMEAAAMAGEKDAKKFAKKGFKSGNIYEAYDVMRDLKKGSTDPHHGSC